MSEATATLVATVDGEDRAEEADAAQLLVGEHGEADPEREADGHGEQRRTGT